MINGIYIYRERLSLPLTGLKGFKIYRGKPTITIDKSDANS